jgi:hypothetical protein
LPRPWTYICEQMLAAKSSGITNGNAKRKRRNFIFLLKPIWRGKKKCEREKWFPRLFLCLSSHYRIWLFNYGWAQIRLSMWRQINLTPV